MVTFKKLPRPEIEDYPHLRELGSWEKLGKKGYRLQIGLTEEQLKEVLIQELQIPTDSFTVYDPANFAWTWFL